MENIFIETAKDANFQFMDTNTSKKAEVSQGYVTLSAGPFLPIRSGGYDIEAIETADSQGFTVIGKYRAFLV